LASVLQTTSVPPEEVPALVEERFGDRGREAFMWTGAQQLVGQGRAARILSATSIGELFATAR
jgi:hypothetical protein